MRGKNTKLPPHFSITHKRPIAMRLFTILFSCILFVTCESENPKTITPKRTLLVYLAGDNNLSEEVKQKSDALLSGWQPSLGELLILADSHTGSSPYLLKAQKVHNQITYDTIKYYQETNSASSSLLSSTIEDMKNIAPAESYGLILFSHATGWLPQGAFNNPTTWQPSTTQVRSIFLDLNNEMELNDFANAIPDNLFDFIAFDMCFMAGIEVAYALRNKTPFLLASAAEILSPGFTPLYQNNLYRLYQDKADLTGFAEEFYNYYNNQSGLYRSATISVIRTNLIEDIKTLTQRLEINRTAIPYGIQYYDRNGEPHLFYDFKQYLTQLTDDENDLTYISNLFDSTVIYKKNTEKMINININTHSGLSVYIPQSTLPFLNTAYLNTSWKSQ